LDEERECYAILACVQCRLKVERLRCAQENLAGVYFGRGTVSGGDNGEEWLNESREASKSRSSSSPVSV
jgi:hypothetical protein